MILTTTVTKGKEIRTLMNDKLLIELLDDLTDPQNDDVHIQNVLLERCLNAPRSELEEFVAELRNSCIYIPTLKIFTSRLCDEPLRFNSQAKLNVTIRNLASLLLTDVVMQNLNHSDTPGFGELLYNCIELLWKFRENNPGSLTDNKGNNLFFHTTKIIFKAILDARVLGILVTSPPGRRCIKRILFDFRMINQIEQEQLLSSVDIVASLVEKCSEHKEVSSRQEEGFSAYKACTALLETLKSHQNAEKISLGNRKNSLPPMLHDMVKFDNKESRSQHWNRKRAATSANIHSTNSVSMSIKDEQYLNLLGMSVPQKPSDLHNLLRELEKRKIELFQDLLGFLPCTNCHKRALISFFPGKYFSEKESEDNESMPEHLFRLPFEFDDNDKLGPWDILLSDDTIKDMRQLESPLVIKAIMKKLGRISSGKWYDLRRKVETHNIPVFEIELPDNDGLKILWQVDCGFSVRNLSPMQLVKVWAVTANQEQINTILENLSIVHQVYTSKHSHLCTIEKVGKDDVILPLKLSEEEIKSSEDNLHSSQIDDEKLLEVHKMLVTNKFIPLSTNLYKSLILGGFDFTFQVSKKEYEIINNPSSAIIIGRSGTGKTTCIVFRQIASFLNSQLCKTTSSRDNCYKRQIFITVSHNLCRRVKEYFNRLRESAVLAGKKMNMEQYHEYIRKKEEEGGDIDLTNHIMLEEGDEEQEFSDVPDSFRDLTDHHFPLFITYDKFSKMLQGTYDIDVRKLTKQQKPSAYDTCSYEDNDEESSITSSFFNKSDSSWAHFVNYDLFQKKYWPRFNDYSRKLDCELVYAEFSIIKGSNPEMDCLSREDYREISTKKYPAFCQNRDQIYDLFQQYEKMKARNGDYDSMDRTLAILRCAKKKSLGGPHIHEVYIDECQDNQIVDFALILKVFDNVDAIFLAGDIAQCIARGSSFRFQDLRALMYQWELSRIQTHQNRRSIAKPKQFELNINYRSHNGILQLASSVIDLIWRFFPKSIDRLSRERGEIGGPRPIFFGGFQKEHFKVFSVGERMANYIEFGAEQVIIVRDDKAKVQLKDLIGKAGLVMTVFEAKGMEFSDVLLYNFFTDSPARLKWRVIQPPAISDEIKHQIFEWSKANENKRHIDIANHFNEMYPDLEIDERTISKILLQKDSCKEISDSNSAQTFKSKGIQTFYHEKHYILSSELKHLYVAVTRAREHIWICDENAEYSMPIRMYWDKYGLIKVIESVDEINTFSTLAKKSTSYEWDQQGKKFFAQRQYEQAMFCFEKSGNEESYKLANAYYLQQIARDSVNNSDDSTIKKNFINAAQAFEKCSRPTQAASCYKEISMYKEAGKVYAEWNMYEPAALCYNKAKMFREAGEYYEKAKKYTDAVVAYKSGSRYEEVIDLMQRQRKEIDEKIFHRVTRLVNIYYRRENNKVMSEKALSIIPTQEERFELLKDHAPEEFLEACEKNGQFRDAAEDLHSRGKFKEAADMFIRSGFKDEDVIEAFQCFLHLCRVNVLKSTMTNTTSPSNAELREIICTVSETLNKIESQLSKALKKSERWKILMEEFRLYDAYLEEDLSRVHKCIQFFRKREELVAEFRAINLWLKVPQQSDIQFEYWHERLQCLQRLCADLAFPYIDTRRNFNNLKTRKEFEEIFVVSEVKDREQKRKCSFDNPLVHLIGEDTAENIEYWHVYDVEVMHQTISQLLVSYIYELLWNVNQRGREIPFISSYICKDAKSCQKLDCRQHDVVPSPSILYQRLTLACLQYNVMRQWDLFYHRRLLKDEQSKEVRPAERWWTERLINYHIRYQSPQTSCPEVTNMVLANHAWYGLIETADKIWLGKLSNEPSNFAVMLKCMFVFQQLRDEWCIDKFDWEMSKTIEISYPNDLPVGYGYYGYPKAIPVGKRLSSFFSWLRSNHYNGVINAIMHIKKFIQYAINHAERVNIITSDAFSDLVSLVEFEVSLVFAVAPGYCNFCLPRAYLVNYFDAFTTAPLIPDCRRPYDRENYNSAIKNSLEQVHQLLEYLIYDERIYQYQMIILRLIRLSVLIGMNEPTFATRVFKLFKYLNNKFSFINIKIKKYVEENHMGRLVNILKDDLKETGCDSLVIVQYQWGGVPRFAELEKSGVMLLKYKSNEGFRDSLLRIKSSVVVEGSAETSVPAYKSVPQRTEQSIGPISFVVDSEEDEDDDRFSISKDASEPTTDTQAWFRQIQDSPRAQEEAKKIQDWFRRAIEKRQKSRDQAHDQAQKKIYNDVRDFCQVVIHWECAMTQKKEKAVRKYHMLLRGLAVDVIVELTKLRDIMDKIKNKLKKKINDPTDGEKLEIYLELEDDLKYIHNENVKLGLNSISITENMGKHEEADIEWLKYELQQARNTINQVKEWIDNYKAVI